MTLDVRWADLEEEYPAKIVWIAEMSLKVITEGGIVLAVFVFFAGGSFSTRGEGGFVFFAGGIFGVQR